MGWRRQVNQEACGRVRSFFSQRIASLACGHEWPIGNGRERWKRLYCVLCHAWQTVLEERSQETQKARVTP